ncbi:unnamed protein product [Lupinus luteus]|uniref:Mitochondrial splicing suppressor 51-like C-terminal domain-containing protein n=1 Tax=Lupinus luteus TaxID=3873 RepID=A0AAV1YKT0_LUPLU
MDLNLKSLFGRFQEQFGPGPGLGPGSGTCLMKVNGIEPNFIRSLYKASAALYRTEPWIRLRLGHYFGVRVGKDSDWSGKKQPFPCVQFIGGDEGDVGFYMFRSENDAKILTGPRETIHVPSVDKEGGPKFSTMASFEPFIETVHVQWSPEVAKTGYNLVVVTMSHPPGQAYEEIGNMSIVSTPTNYREPPRDGTFNETKAYSSAAGLRQCAMCDKEKQHWNDTHKSMCGLYKAMMEREEELAIKVFMFPCSADQPCKWLESLSIHQKGMWRRKCSCYSHCPFGLLPVKGGLQELWGRLDEFEYPHDSPFHNDYVSSPFLLSGWSEYYNLRSIPFASPVADILSHPLTVYHILTTLNISSKKLILKGKDVIVHYLGPEGELDWMSAFAEVSHLLNGLGNVHIVMVGPEVPTNLSDTTSGMGSRVRVNLVRGVYQVEASYLPTPHVVIALNSRLERYSSWGGALDLIKLMAVPAFFTDQSEASCLNAKQGLRNVGLHITQPVTPNPFRSPVKNLTPSCNLPSYSNGFVSGVNT